MSDVSAAHDEGLRIAGGATGLRDAHLLASAVEAPRSGYYATLAQMAGVYAHGITKNHAFVDGNKRTAFASMAAFLRANGYPGVFGSEWSLHFERLGSGDLSRDDLVALITEAMGGDPVELV